MVQKESVPTGWTTAGDGLAGEARIQLSSSSGSDHAFTFGLETVKQNVFRTTFTSRTHPLPPHPSIPRRAADAKATATATIANNSKTATISSESIQVKVDWESSSTPELSVSLDGNILHTDVPHRSYVVDGLGVAHYSRYNRGTLHVGLGEKAAPMDLSGRSFILSATDSFGYDNYRTDPLYKHIPLLINATPDGCVALFSTSHSRGFYSVGAEMDGMWGRYKVYRQDYGGLEEYIIVGHTLKDIVQSYAELAGYPLLVPRWAFGYLSGGMKYSMLDEPPASVALLELAHKMKEHDIPCSAYQMSSGYTVSEVPPKTRNVFTWNHHRFPDPKGWIHEYHKLGMRLIANIKPYVIASHPEYKRLKDSGALFTDPATGTTAVTRLWSAGGGESDEGGHIDFTSESGFRWWYEGVRTLCKEGIDCMWNDNNEYTVTDDEWICALDNPALDIPDDHSKDNRSIGLWGRFLNTELHGKASHDAMAAARPDERPFVLTRSATAGTMRYACSSWSGDNTTSWASMKGSNALGLNAGMCLLQCYGHDIGGFEGPQPGPELLLRWVQLGIYSQRFAINCFKTGTDNSVGDVIEPWMYPSITHLVRKAIKRRYAMIPYLYSLMLQSHQAAVPPQRWTGWGYEKDAEVWKPEMANGETQYWLGDTLLIGGVYEPGVSKARVYLPRSSDEDGGYLNLNAPYQHLAAGQWVDIDAEWHGAGIAVLAKVGTVLPVGRDVQVLSPGEKSNVADLPPDDYRAVEIFPPPAGLSSGQRYPTNTWLEDDGVSCADNQVVSAFRFGYAASEDRIDVEFVRSETAGFAAPWRSLVVVLPSGDERYVACDKWQVKDLGRDEQSRRRFELL